MPFTTKPLDLGNTLARAAEINALRNRNEFSKFQLGQERGIQNALATDDIDSLSDFGAKGATLEASLKKAAREGRQDDFDFGLKFARTVNQSAKNALASPDLRQSAQLATKALANLDPELGKAFAKTNWLDISEEEARAKLQEAIRDTEFSVTPTAVSNLLSGSEATDLGFDAGTVLEQKSIGGQVTGTTVKQKPSRIQRIEQGGPGAFSGTTSQRFKKREDLRASVVNTSLAIDQSADLVKLAIAEPGTIGNPGAIFSFGNNFLRTAEAIMAELLPGKDLEVDFGPDDMNWDVFQSSRLRKLASSNAQFRAGVFSIAIAAAVAEQGSRPSDKDVQANITRIGGDSSDVLSFTPTIAQFVKNIDSRVRKMARVGGFQKEFLDSVLPELDRSIEAFNAAVSSKSEAEQIPGFDQLTPAQKARLKELEAKQRPR